MSKLKLTKENYKWIAEKIHPNCEPEMVIAFSKVECKREPFDADGFPAILYERHVTFRNIKPHSKALELANKRSDLIYPKGYGRGGYGSYGSQRIKLSKAMTLLADAGLNRDIALEGCSWGAFQELGENWEDYGFKNVGEFVDTMKDGLFGQSLIFIRSIKSRGLVEPMVKREYATLARKYNGAGYREFNYDGQIETAYIQTKKEKTNWANIEALPPAKNTNQVWLGSLLNNKPQIDSNPDLQNEAHNNEDLELESNVATGVTIPTETGETPTVTTIETVTDPTNATQQTTVSQTAPTATASQPEPYNGIGFWATIKRDMAALGFANLGAEGGFQMLEKLQLIPEWLIPLLIKAVTILAIISVAYFVFRIIHWLVDTWKQNQRVKFEKDGVKWSN